MKDFQNQIEKLEREALDCDLIARLATDEKKRATFNRLAMRYRATIEELRGEMPKE